MYTWWVWVAHVGLWNTHMGCINDTIALQSTNQIGFQKKIPSFILDWLSSEVWVRQEWENSMLQLTLNTHAPINNFRSCRKLQKQIKHIRLGVYTLNGTVWYPFCQTWSSITCFKSENFGCKRQLHVSGKITTILRLISWNLPQMENKHQIMNVHTKWNCLIPILSGLVKY